MFFLGWGTKFDHLRVPHDFAQKCMFFHVFGGEKPWCGDCGTPNQQWVQIRSCHILYRHRLTLRSHLWPFADQARALTRLLEHPPALKMYIWGGGVPLYISFFHTFLDFAKIEKIAYFRSKWVRLGSY